MRDRLERAVMAAGRLNSRASVLFHSHMAGLLGLNATDTKALDLVMEHGPMTPTEIARATGLTSASVTVLLDRLEAKGLVERSPDPADRRRIRVSARPTALEAMAHHILPFLGELEASLSRYSDAELKAIERFLRESAEIALHHAGASRD